LALSETFKKSDSSSKNSDISDGSRRSGSQRSKSKLGTRANLLDSDIDLGTWTCKATNQDLVNIEKWNLIYNAVKIGYILTTSTTDKFKPRLAKMGLTPNHPYTILAVYEIIEGEDSSDFEILEDFEVRSDKAKTRLLKIRNPWWSKDTGAELCCGKFCPGDPKWTYGLGAALGYDPYEPNGIFFMCFEEYLKCFCEFQICYYDPASELTSYRIQIEPYRTVYYYFDIELYGEGFYWFGLHQYPETMFSPASGYKYSPVCLTLFKLHRKSRDSTYIGSTMQATRDHWLRVYLGSRKKIKSRYYLAVYAPWRSFVKDATLSIYGQTVITCYPFSPEILPPYWLTSLMVSKMRSNPNGWLNFKNFGYPLIKYKYELANDGFGYIYWENQYKDVILTIKMNFSSASGIKILDKYSNTKNPIIEVYPQEADILIYRITALPSTTPFNFIGKNFFPQTLKFFFLATFQKYDNLL
jgi:hypothetical protein